MRFTVNCSRVMVVHVCVCAHAHVCDAVSVVEMLEGGPASEHGSIELGDFLIAVDGAALSPNVSIASIR